MLQFALRLGDDPRVCVTTTPRAVDVLKTLLASPSTVMTHAPTSANRANLAASFLAEVNARYAGTRLGQQELDGVLIDAVDGALWRDPDLAQLTVDTCPEFARVVVAVDPPVTGHARSDSCGIIVAGISAHDPTRAVVIADYSVQGTSPLVWAQVAIDAYHTHNADRLIAEVNQGGDLVETVIRQVDPNVSYRAIRASRGKVARAEPVAALYEQGRVQHLRGLSILENQMVQMSAQGFHGTGSPDRVDALVWALHDLLLSTPRTSAPRFRV